MKIKTLIVDDEPEARKLLQLYLEKYELIELVGFSQNGKQAVNDIQTFKPDLVLLDIQMPEWDGFEVLENIAEPFPHIIFVTAFNQYALNAFEKNATDYVLKPYSEARLFEAVKRAITSIQNNKAAHKVEYYRQLFLELSSHKKPSDTQYLQRLAIKSNKRTRFVDVADLIYLEAADQYVDVFTKDAKFTIRESMDHLERALDPQLFFRTHRSYIIKIKEISGLENVDKHLSFVILKSGKKVKLSSARKSAFKLVLGI